MKKIKVLNEDMTSPFQNFKYELGRKYTAEYFDEDESKTCSNGLYATGIKGLLYTWNIHRRTFECEVDGKTVIYNQFKQRFEHLTLIRELGYNELKDMALQKEAELGYNLSEVLFPVNPLHGKSKKVTRKEIKLLRRWDSVWGSVWGSIRDSVWGSVWGSVRDSVRGSVWDSVEDSVKASVWDSIWDSIRDSVWDSVGDSVWDSVWDSVGDFVEGSVRDFIGGYISSLFPNITDWKYIEHEKGKNPFQSGIDLWRSGFVPSFDGITWRLHSGEKGEIVYEIKKENL